MNIIVKSEAKYASSNVNVKANFKRDNRIHDVRKETKCASRFLWNIILMQDCGFSSNDYIMDTK